MDFSDLPTATPSKLKYIINTAISAGLAWAIPGPSGAGKSELMASIIDQLDDQVKSGTPIAGHEECDRVIMMKIMAPQYDEYTLRGLQTFMQNESGKFVTACADPSWKVQYDELRRQHPNALIVVFLDEIGVASEAMQASLLELINDKRIDQHAMSEPDKVVFVTAYNRREDGASFFNMSKPLARRFGGHTVIQPSVEDFLIWGHNSGKIAPEVDLFLSQHPDALIQAPEEDFANDISPRGWEYVSRILNETRLDTGGVPISRISTMLASRMTHTMLTQFQTSINLAGEMPRWTDVLADPEGARVPQDILVQAMSLRAFASQMVDQRSADAFLLYLNRCTVEAVGAAASVAVSITQRVDGSWALGDLGFVFSAAESQMLGKESEMAEKRAAESVAAARGRFAQSSAVARAQHSDDDDDAVDAAKQFADLAKQPIPNADKIGTPPASDFTFDFSDLN